MAEWRAGTKTGRTLWRDEVLVGMVDSPEVAAEIVETMNRVGALLAEVRAETAGERSQPWVRCPAETAGLLAALSASGHIHRCSWPAGGEHVHHCECGTDWTEITRTERLPRLLHDPYDETKGGVTG